MLYTFNRVLFAIKREKLESFVGKRMHLGPSAAFILKDLNGFLPQWGGQGDLRNGEMAPPDMPGRLTSSRLGEAQSEGLHQLFPASPRLVFAVDHGAAVENKPLTDPLAGPCPTASHHPSSSSVPVGLRGQA